MDAPARLRALIRADPWRMALLREVAALDLPDAWIGAGFLRDIAWDALHGRRPSPCRGDVDVVWFGAAPSMSEDRVLEARLRAALPGVDWSVTNQARMHARNGDAPYRDTADAMRHWPETATAVAARLNGGAVEILAPLGLEDLLGGVIRPAPRFTGEKRDIVERRVAAKGWLARWPLLRRAEPY
ncbi:nucleotidyltransferase family protein [Roseomonas xinghualingensis]|uniref:nucleotidyltransferase family protein n=1 Tax=Roseomonas xinghualingensis TaxID=2986475 RepID=UPI0021F23849|nr:nucleotidyltransferase family protein [Roseomonas sp. SXEYE001]MCV4208289.1 nucleotidyltransferase family protein [Roseomonas sp. SXEYE001]